MIKTVEKPWGVEYWLALTKDYCFKKIVLKKGCKTSLQYHEKKEETIIVGKGKAVYHHKENGVIQTKNVEEGFCVHLLPFTVHRFEAVGGDLVLYEASTIHIDDVVRLEDSYYRK